MKRKLTVGAVLSASAILASAIQVGAGLAEASPAPVAAQQRATLIAQADAQAPAAAKALGLGSQEKLVAKDAVVDADGTRHLRYERTFGGLPVLGGDLVVHQDAKGTVKSVDRAVQGSVAPATLSPKLTAAQASAAAAGAVQATVGTSRDADEPALASAGRAGTAQLVVWAASGTPRLAYRTTVGGIRADGTPSSQLLVTDAATGELLSSDEQIHTSNATGTGYGVFDGTVTLTTNYTGSTYQLKDNTRGGMYTVDKNGTLYTDADNIWGNGQASNGQSAAVDAQFGAATTWDYYKNVHGRNGIKNNGVGAYSKVHYGTNYVNAFWDDGCFCMTYGDGSGNTHPLTAIDVAGHEMTHGVTSATAGLNYSGESGGLNEATSDIFGTMVEFYANLPTDTPDYLIGERLNLNGNGTPLRYMDKPSKDGASADYWSSTVGNKDVHYSSGVANHFFYLLSEGSGAKVINGVSYNSPTYTGTAVTGIGRDKAAKIWYRALTVYMTSTTNYKAARTATQNAAKDLYGAASTEYNAVAAAWKAVNVN
ncbi:M4 family metallopeptidase [Kitasatospora sp. MBT63]|uniref:M4 family metallopeptidase n=1 Tax=Kitasatospora sp. MBT63 TaxID=1444768 RepID=UPI000539CB36|nr:M4 family metallopeptidase [Kitasatospora sp. MBT63]